MNTICLQSATSDPRGDHIISDRKTDRQAEHDPALLEQSRRQNERLQKALEINQLIAGELHLRPLLHRIMEITRGIMDAELCSLFLADEEHLVFYINSGESEDGLRRSAAFPWAAASPAGVPNSGRPCV